MDELGSVDTVAGAFAAAAAPARRTARVLVFTGPLAAACWATVLISAHAWSWPVPGPARLGLGLTLTAVIALLIAAVRTGRYRLARSTATAACLGLIALDGTLATALIAPPLVRGWPLALAATVGLARIGFTAHALRRIRTG